MAFTPNPEQKEAIKAMVAFVKKEATSTEFFCLNGYSGCGKTATISYFINLLPKISKLYNSIASVDSRANHKDHAKNVSDLCKGAVLLSATTHQAAEVLEEASGQPVLTIHSLLNLTIRQDFRDGSETLVQKHRLTIKDALIIIDEASMVGWDLIKFIRASTQNCKIIFVQDPNQVLGVGQKETPSRKVASEEVYLTTPVRQAKDSPILTIGTNARNTLAGKAPFPGFPKESETIKYIRSKEALEERLLADFPKDYRQYKNQIKYLAWTNQEVEEVNSFIRSQYTDEKGLIPGEVVKANSIITSLCGYFGLSNAGLGKVADSVQENQEFMGVYGQILNIIPIHGLYASEAGMGKPMPKTIQIFRPYSIKEAKERIKELGREGKEQGDFREYFEAKKFFSDIRVQYASTVHKAQGSTFDTAIVNVGNILQCRNMDTVLRMIYVATTRPRHTLYLYNLP